jgi:serine/threonine-protein kinase RsbW
MDYLQRTKILSRRGAADFVGRQNEMEKLLCRAKGEDESGSLLFLHAPATGASELLGQIFDSLFSAQEEIVPVYFPIHKNHQTAKTVAAHFLQNFLLQSIAFRRRDEKLLNSFPAIQEFAELAAPEDRHWIDPLLAVLKREGKFADDYSFIKNCFAAPLRLASAGAKIFVMIDDLHRAEKHFRETNLIEELEKIYSSANIPFVLAGRRRFLLDAARSGGERLRRTEIMRLDPLPDSDAELLINKLAEKYAVKINEQTRDLIARQLDSNPLFIEAIFEAAAEREIDLDSFQNVQQIYVDEIFGGRIGKFFDSEFEQVAPNFSSQTQIIRHLRKTALDETQKSRAEKWRGHFDIPDEEFHRMLRDLHTAEIINSNSNSIEAEDENLCLKDYLEARYRLEISNEQRALAVGSQLAKSLKRAPQLMALFYRRASILSLRELLTAFNCQAVPESLLDYTKFKDIYKGLPADEILRQVESENEKANLPQIVFAAHAAAFYPQLRQVSDLERSAVALGFESADYRAENEIVWIAAEIDSKLEAAKELTEFWCDRLEMAALACDFTKYQLWLVAPEGFSPEAVEVLKERNGMGASREQVKLLIKYLNAENLVQEKSRSNEYEMIIPMGDDTELIAAHAVEEIARKHSFQPKAITQIKTALVEACINAAEHSHSPDRKIYQKFAVEDDKIIITISNRGIRIPSEKVAEMTMQIEPDEGRRGWGLKLMRTLMDDVKFEQVDDGTRISMVKYLK